MLEPDGEEVIRRDWEECAKGIGSVHSNDNIIYRFSWQDIVPGMVGMRLLSPLAPQSSCTPFHGMGDPHMQGALISALEDSKVSWQAVHALGHLICGALRMPTAHLGHQSGKRLSVPGESKKGQWQTIMRCLQHYLHR